MQAPAQRRAGAQKREGQTAKDGYGEARQCLDGVSRGLAEASPLQPRGSEGDGKHPIGQIPKPTLLGPQGPMGYGRFGRG